VNDCGHFEIFDAFGCLRVEMLHTQIDSERSPTQVMPFSRFLGALIAALEKERLRPCILRNYEGFPNENLGNDVDFLILPSDLPRAMRALGSIAGIQIVGFAEHPHVASVFLAGTSALPGSRSIQIDFFGILGWKGLPYIPVENVLRDAIPRDAGEFKFFVPCPIHEAIISLMTSLVVSAWLKEKYLPGVQRTFSENKVQTISALAPQFGMGISTRLVEAVIEGRREEVMACVRPLRRSLASRSLSRAPIRSLTAIVRHYSMEFNALYLPRSLESICIAGREGWGKSRLIEALAPLLQSSAKGFEIRQVPGRMAQQNMRTAAGLGSGTNAKKAGGFLTSMGRALGWHFKEWASVFIRKKNLLLRINEGCYHDLVVDPARFGYNGPLWFVSLLERLLPSQDLWILLDGTIPSAQAGKGSPSEQRKQSSAYRDFIASRKRNLVIDPEWHIERQTEAAYAGIIDMLAKRTDIGLKARF
jgi:hypothetical protein